MPIKLTGNEWGLHADNKALCAHIRAFAQANWKDRTIVNIDSGLEIRVSMAGVKHTLSGAKQDLLAICFKLPELLETTTLSASTPPKDGQLGITEVHRFECDVIVGGRQLDITIVAKASRGDGIQFYDLGILKK